MDVPVKRLREFVGAHTAGADPLFFALSGAHAYGVVSPASDFDVRGVFVEPARKVLSIGTPREKVEVMEGDVDMLAFELGKFARLLAAGNANCLEWLFLPAVVAEGEGLEELRDIVRKDVISKVFLGHYVGAARSIKKQWSGREELEIKPALYGLRWMLSGLHLLRTGEVDVNIPRLNELYLRDPVLEELAERHAAGETVARDPGLVIYCEELYRMLSRALEEAMVESSLPAEPKLARLDRFVYERRMGGV